MILVSGAGGKTGRAVIAALVERRVPVRAFLRRDDTIRGAETFVGDMAVALDWANAIVGCRAIYHICPNMHVDEVEIGRKAIAAAQSANISHFVYHSVLHPQTQDMPHHWNKLLVEEMLLASGLPFTILQPTAYMQNINVAQVQASGTHTVPYGVESRISLVDLNDVAQAAVAVLTENGHVGATYQLVGTPPLSQVEVAAQLSEALGCDVVAEAVEVGVWRDSAEKANLSPYAINTLIAMFRYYDQHGLHGNPNALRWILGRAPNSLEDCFTGS